jgi:hypothetical protein
MNKLEEAILVSYNNVCDTGIKHEITVVTENREVKKIVAYSMGKVIRIDVKEVK